MITEHPIDKIRRCLHHLCPLRQKHRLKNVDHLCNVGHRDTVAHLVEDIQIKARRHRIPHRILLIQESGIGSFFRPEPVAPLVHNKSDLLLRIIAVQNLRVFFQNFLQEVSALHGQNPLLIRKGKGAALIIPAAKIHIIVNTQSVHKAMALRLVSAIAFLQKLLCPVIIISGRSDRDFLRGHLLRIMKERLIQPVSCRIILREHVPSAAPAFISKPEKFHFPGLPASVFGAQTAHRRLSVKGDVFHPVLHLLYRSAANVAIDIGFAAQHFTKMEEFMGSEAVVLQDSSPVGIDDLFTGFQRSDPIHPMILIGKAAARPADHRNLDFTKRIRNIRANPVFIRNSGLRTDKQSFINSSSQMLRKLTVDFLPDSAFLFLFIYCNVNRLHFAVFLSPLLLRV